MTTMTMTMTELFAELPQDIQQDIHNMYHRQLPFLPELQVIQKLLVEYEFYSQYFAGNEFEEFYFYTRNDENRYEEDTDRLIAFLYGPNPNLREDDPLEYLPEPLQDWIRKWDQARYDREIELDDFCECTDCGRPLMDLKSFFKGNNVVCVYCCEMDEPFDYKEYKEMISTNSDEELRELELALPTEAVREKQAILDVLRGRNDSESDEDED